MEAQPTESIYTTGETKIGGQRIEYGYLLEAHTDGDVYVFFRDANVLAVGDAISPQRDPELDWFGGGWLGGRVDSLEHLLDITDAQTRFVPSYGRVVGRAAVQASTTCASAVRRFFELVRKGESAEDMLAAGIMEGTGRTWNDPVKFVHDAHKGFWAHHNTLVARYRMKHLTLAASLLLCFAARARATPARGSDPDRRARRRARGDRRAAPTSTRRRATARRRCTGRSTRSTASSSPSCSSAAPKPTSRTSTARARSPRP